MNELIKVDADAQVVSARELHEALGVEKRFSAWFETNSQGFVEGEDFTSVLSGTVVNNGAHRELQDYNLSVDMAKHICLMSRTDKGKACRQYLIDVEKAWNTPEQVMARALKIANQTIDSLKENNIRLIEANERMRPKEIFADAVATSKTSILVGDLAKLICQNGYQIGQKRLFQWLRDNGYLIKRKGADWNMPTQKSLELGLFEIKESTHIDGNGCNVTTRTPKATGKAQIYFINKFLGSKKNEGFN
jgi:anti-repressor protein